MRGRGAEVIKMWEVKKTGEDVDLVMFVFWHIQIGIRLQIVKVTLSVVRNLIQIKF